MLRVAQACYDFWLDLTGVTVGTYRRNVFILTFTVSAVAKDLCAGHHFEAVIELPFAFLLWFVMRNIRCRARTDDADQAAGRYSFVNRRAMADQASIHVVIPITVFCLSALYLAFSPDRVWGFLQTFIFTTLLLNECLLVRERDATRFTLKRPTLVAAGSAA